MPSYLRVNAYTALQYDSFDSSGNPPHVGVIGAGLAGLRSADLLLQHGFRVTILEARDRVGGRLHQVKLSNGHLIDIGPNWIHGTEENSIMDLALETETVTGAPSEGSLVYDEDGKPLSVSDGTMCHELMWDIIKDAFQYSNEFGSEIPADRSLLDYFHEKVVEKIPETEPDFERKRRQVLQMSEFWGAFVGSPIERQSLKFFWLEECLDGGKLLVFSHNQDEPKLTSFREPLLRWNLPEDLREDRTASQDRGYDQV